SFFHAGLDAWTDRKGGDGDVCPSDTGSDPSTAPESPPWEDPQIRTSPEDRRPPGERTCQQCRGLVDGKARAVVVEGRTVWLHAECEAFYRKAAAASTPPPPKPPKTAPPDPWAEAGEIPPFLRRTNGDARAPALGPPDDSLDDFQW